MYKDEIESTIDFIRTCIDEYCDYTVITESIDELVALKDRLGELNSLCLNNPVKPQYIEYSCWLCHQKSIAVPRTIWQAPKNSEFFA